MSCPRAQRRTINHWTIFIYMRRAARREKREEIGTCLPLLLSLWFCRRVSGGSAHCHVGWCSLIGQQDRSGPRKERREMPSARITFDGIIPTGNAGIAPREWRRNVIFQIIVMIFLVTQTLDICHDPARGGQDWLTEKEAMLFVD